MNRIDELVRIVPPPVDPYRVDWKPVEKLVGQLPHDYKAAVETYGPGSFANFLWLLLPSKLDYLDISIEGQLRSTALRESRDECPSEVPYLVFPEHGGLLPWLTTENGDTGWFLRDHDDPDEWSVVISASRSPEFFRFKGGCTEFLVAVLADEVHVPIFGRSPFGVPIFQRLDAP